MALKITQAKQDWQIQISEIWTIMEEDKKLQTEILRFLEKNNIGYEIRYNRSLEYNSEIYIYSTYHTTSTDDLNETLEKLISYKEYIIDRMNMFITKKPDIKKCLRLT